MYAIHETGSVIIMLPLLKTLGLREVFLIEFCGCDVCLVFSMVLEKRSCKRAV